MPNTILDLITGYATLGGVVFACLGNLLAFFKYFLIANKLFAKNQTLSARNSHKWVLWPAYITHFIFEKIFGEIGNSIKDLFTVRSLLSTLLISISANCVCLLFIILMVPADFQLFDLLKKQAFINSYLMFIVFNFFGDMVSVNFTRYIVAKISKDASNYLLCIVIDFLGILIGWLITLLPVILAFLYSYFYEVDISIFLDYGFLGSAIIPFFLFIFAFGGMPPVFLFFLSVAVFSVWIPTFLYILFVVICLLSTSRSYNWSSTGQNQLESYLNFYSMFMYKLAGFCVFIILLISLVKFSPI